MAKAKHFATSDMLWNTFAFVDQWQKVMAVYDDRRNLRAVVKPFDEDTYGVLLIGDDTEILYLLDDIELGSTGKSMDACFKIYCRLQYYDNPRYLPSCRKTEQIHLYQIFPHTRVSARRTGGFHVTTEDLSERITKALKRYDEITAGDVRTLDCVEYDGYDGYPDTIYGYAGKMYHVGDGAYCDDGDNWDFF